MFGKRGDAVAPFLLRGQLVGVVGELSEREWTDKDGMKRSSLEVRVNDLTLLGKRDNDSRPPVRSQQGPSTAASDFDESQDIPF